MIKRHDNFALRLLVLAMLCNPMAACNGQFQIHRGRTEPVEEEAPKPAPAKVEVGKFNLVPMSWARKSDASISVSWVAASGAVTYDLSLAKASDCKEAVKEVKGLTTTSYDFGVLAAGTYYVCVTAISPDSTAVPSNNGYRLFITPGYVLGQTTVSTAVAGGGALGQNGTAGTWSDGERLAVVDSSNNRVLIWNKFPTTATTAPDIILGQPDATTVTANTGGVSAQSMSGPITVHFDGVHFIVTEYNNHRILIWNTFPTTNRQAADVVVGQAAMTTNAFAVTATGLRHPSSAMSDGTKLYVSDDTNNRILIYNTFPTSHGAAANVVLGQGGSFTTGTWDGAGATQASIDDPSSVWVDSGKLIVTDSGNNRVLIWNSIPTAQVNPDVVLGQANFTTVGVNSGGVSASSINYPTGAAVFGGKLYVSDRENHRVLAWNAIPTSNNAPADKVYGQTSFTTITPNTGGINETTMNGPQTTMVTDVFAIVSEMYGHRTLLIPLQ